MFKIISEFFESNQIEKLDDIDITFKDTPWGKTGEDGIYKFISLEDNQLNCIKMDDNWNRRDHAIKNKMPTYHIEIFAIKKILINGKELLPPYWPEL